ncbi:hypothetical protein RHGRI_018128 [Rhododendron griersonianum]|uniref:Uncharacterized protein n=1 Tax=Rhododendron griersonianum TaxID=479676 RepID=A0AAV6K0I0_9ERIC|nr:hypothetical protein RHGRI_018128 [Rhododendron griersonianum]
MPVSNYKLQTDFGHKELLLYNLEISPILILILFLIMQQKVVIKLHINGEKSRSKALQIASGVSGIESLTLAGEDKNQIEVTGEGIDAAALTMLFRRKMGYSELVSVGPVPEDGGSSGGGDQRENAAKVQIPVWGYYNYPYAYGTADMHEIRYQNPNNCSIM